VNMALIALPCKGQPVLPPLPLSYLATLLEQRRHIVRIYDLALEPQQPLRIQLQPLRTFQPKLIIVAGDQPEVLQDALDALHADHHTHVLPLQMSRSGIDAACVCAKVIEWIDEQGSFDERSTRRSSTTLYQDIDHLPSPARHLLSLERYNLRAVGGELQTTLLAGALNSTGDQIVMRSPTQIVAELRNVSIEFGMRHFFIVDVPITIDPTWLRNWTTQLTEAQLHIRWEANADVDQLTPRLMHQIAQAGCEKLNFHLDAARVFESTGTRDHLRSIVSIAREHGIFVHASVKLEPPYESIPHLVDVAATFGLDDVSFDVATPANAATSETDDQELQAMARQIYDAGRDRQRFIDRFGTALGSLIWKLRGNRRIPNDLDDESLMA
jgi:hypothetical protein